MPDKPNLITTGLSGMIGDRFKELYGHKFEFFNMDLSTDVDITDAKAVDNFIQSAQGDIILHLAAFTDVDESIKQHGDKSGSCYQVNVVGTENIAKSAKKFGKYMIHISTDYVFDGSKNKPYNEDMPTNPILWYGITKAMSEEVVAKHLEHYSILRPSFPFRSAFEPKLDVVRKIIKGLSEDSLPAMFTDNSITPTFIDDLCKVFFMFTLKRPRGIYHATGGSSLSTYDLAVKVKDILGLSGEIKGSSLSDFIAKTNRQYPKSLKMNNAKLQEELGNPMLTIDSALMIMKTQM